MKTRSILVAATFVALASQAAPVRSEVIGPLLPRQAIEMGFTARETDRILEYEGEESRFVQRDIPFTLRYGISTTTTLSLELSGNLFNDDDDVSFYTVGASVQLLVWRARGYTITMGLSYARTLGIDEIDPKKQYDEQFLDWVLLGQREFLVHDQEFTLWLGPRVSYMSVKPQAPEVEIYNEAKNLLGGVVGAGFLLVDHIVLQGQLVYIDEPEYRLNLAYRF